MSSLNLNPVASMNLANHARDDRGGSARLDIQDHHLADDLARHLRPMFFHFLRCDWSMAIASFWSFFRASRLDPETTATKTVAIKAVHATARALLGIEPREIAGAEWTINREVIAGLDFVFTAEIDVDDVVARHHLAAIFRHHQTSGRFSGRLGKLIEIAPSA